MAPKIRRIVTVGCTATLALVSICIAVPAAQAATTSSSTSASAKASATWLVSQLLNAQNKTSAKTGNHLDYPPSSYGPAYWGGLTASAVFGLVAAKTGSADIKRIAAYMKKNLVSDSYIGEGAPGAYDGSVATYALVAEIIGATPTNFGGTNLLAQLKQDECTAVSAPTSTTDYTTPTCPAVGSGLNIYSSVSESLIITAEARAAKTSHGIYAPSTAAVRYFLSLQCPGGGFNGTDANKCTSSSESSVDETAYGLMALEALGGHAAQKHAATEWLIKHRNTKGYWTAQGGPDVDSTGLAVAALDQVFGAGSNQKWLASSRTWLTSQQVTTGTNKGALRYPYGAKFSASSSQKATADGLLGLARGGSLATLKVNG